jgi:hypothetical protein
MMRDFVEFFSALLGFLGLVLMLGGLIKKHFQLIYKEGGVQGPLIYIVTGISFFMWGLVLYEILIHAGVGGIALFSLFIQLIVVFIMFAIFSGQCFKKHLAYCRELYGDLYGWYLVIRTPDGESYAQKILRSTDEIISIRGYRSFPSGSTYEIGTLGILDKLRRGFFK